MSVSTASTTSAIATRCPPTSASRRLRDSASTGNASSASNAAVSLRPCPSPRTQLFERRMRRWPGSLPEQLGSLPCVSVLVRVVLHAAALPHVESRARAAVVSRHLSAERRQGLSASSIRASVSARPSTATVSKMPGETGRPAIATRSGWKTSRGLQPQRSTTAVSAASIVASSNGSISARAPREPAPASRRPSAASHFSRACGSSAGPSNRKPHSGQKSASVWIFSALIATAGPSPSRP